MRVRNAEILARLVRDRRIARGMTQLDLAEAIGASRRWVVKFEADPANARVDLVLGAVAAVGLIVDVSDPAPDADDVFGELFDHD